MLPPERDELAGNPIREMIGLERAYSDNIFDLGDTERYRIPSSFQSLFIEHTRQINRVAQQIRQLGNTALYDLHTDLMHGYWRHPDILQDYFVCRNKAFLKMREILRMMEMETMFDRPMRSFHLCEGPGYFLDAIYVTWIIQNRGVTEDEIKNKLWEWGANTLNPYFENESCFKKLIDDSHIREHGNRWFFGPSDDGDVKKMTEDYLIQNNLAGSFDLVTADGSTDTQGQEGRIEEVVASLIRAEVEAALILLRKNGRLVLKVYRFCDLDTQNVMMLLADNFRSMKVFKPMASRPGSSEKYVICEGFGEKMNFDLAMLFACDEFFVSRQVSRMEAHVRTFVDKDYPWTWDDRKVYIQEMKDRHYTADRHKCRGALDRLFPSGTLILPSPWLKLYGHNLVRRFREEDLDVAVERYIYSANVYPPDGTKGPADIIRDIMSAKVMCVTSDIPLVVKDSLFIEPMAHLAVQTKKKGCYDLYENVSTINRDLGEDWRRHLQKTSEKYTLTLVPGVTIEHILIALLEGLDDDIESFTLSNLPSERPPLYLSRLSASMNILMGLLYLDYGMGVKEIEFENKAEYNEVRSVLTRLLTEIAALPSGTSLRSFVPIELLDYFHPYICLQNVRHLTHINEDHTSFQPLHREQEPPSDGFD